MTADQVPEATVSSAGIPPGFHAIHAGGPFINGNGPLYLRREGGAVTLGLRVEKRHCNPMNHLHGGMMASFCDMLLPLSAYRVGEQAEPRFLLTVSLQIDYIAGAPLGCWLEGSAEMLRSTRTLVFMRGLVSADGTPCARVSGISRIGPPFPKTSDEFFNLVAR
ncbi:MAG: PaaI family thioesterase [Burkholderiaceae bacterium]|jgi:acyl-coenzyme A thioesterase PaaI-like protein|nr:MAG: PaaI family thioesterase [Burkholderiaceae bacterium]